MPDSKRSSRKTADICVGGRKEWRSSHRKDVIAEMWPSCLGGLDSARRSPLLPRAFGTNHPGWRTGDDGGSYKLGGHCDEAGWFTHRIFHFRSHIIKVFWQLETVARLQRWVYMLEIGKNFKKRFMTHLTPYPGRKRDMGNHEPDIIRSNNIQVVTTIRWECFSARFSWQMVIITRSVLEAWSVF